jgi:uncharacterized protein DUF6998
MAGRRVEGPTPAGGAYAILIEVDGRCEATEYDAEGNVVARTYGSISPAGPEDDRGPLTYDPSSRSTRDLLVDFASIMRTLRTRGVVRTHNNPIGDMAEAIVANHYGGTRGSFSQAGWDVRTPRGERLQVKALRQTGARTRRNLSPIRDTDYDAVIVVLFDEDFRVAEGLRISRETVEELFPHRAHVNGRVITVTKKLRAHPAVEVVELSDASLDG